MTRASRYLFTLLFAAPFTSPPSSCAQSSNVPPTLKGNISTYVYSLEALEPNGTSDRQVFSYESIDLEALDLGTGGLSLRTYLRTLNNPADADNEGPSAKVYNLYLEYRKPSGNGLIRIGRQFLYSGVARGKMDGLRFDLTPSNGVTVTGFVGTQEPDGLSTKVDSWSSSHTWGGRVRVDRIPDTQIGWSFNQRSRHGEEEARLIGIDVMNHSIRPIELYGKFDYDHIAKRTSTLVFQASTRIGSKLSLSGEFARHHPQMRSNSILSVFRQEPYDQVRLRPFFRLTENYGLEGSYGIVRYDGDRTHRLSAGLNFGRGSAGFFYRSGYGGKTAGGYGNLYLIPHDDLEIRLAANYQKYRTVEETSPILESFVSSATIDYFRLEPLVLTLELQEARSPEFESDLRLFFRANYRFRVKK